MSETPEPQAPEPAVEAELVETKTDTAREVAVREPAPLVSPTTPMGEWNVMVAQAEVLAQANIVPGAYQRKPANIIAAALAGRVHGWDAMTAMLNGHVIDGKYGVSPEAQLGLIRGRGHSVQKIAEVRGESVTVRGRRADTGDTVDVTWTMDDAKRAKLDTKDNWRNYAPAMLWARAVSELSTQLFSDVTLGLARYTYEELEGSGFENVQAAALAPPLPAGWESWDECNDTHDAYAARWADAPQAAKDAVSAWRKEHAGYDRPMAKAKLNALDAKLTQEIERNPAPEGDAPEVGDGGLTSGGTALPGQREDGDPVTPASAAPPVANDPDGIEDAELVGEGEAEAPAEPTAAPAEAPPAPAQAADDDGRPAAPVESVEPAAPAGFPARPAGAATTEREIPEGERASRGETARLATVLGNCFLPAERDLARHALAAVVSNGATRSSKALRAVEIRWAIKAAKLFEQGKLTFGVLNDDDELVPLDQYMVPTDEQIPSLFAAIPEGGTSAEGDEFIVRLTAFLAGDAG